MDPFLLPILIGQSCAPGAGEGFSRLESVSVLALVLIPDDETFISHKRFRGKRNEVRPIGHGKKKNGKQLSYGSP